MIVVKLQISVVEDHRGHGVDLGLDLDHEDRDRIGLLEEDWSYRLHKLLCGLELPSSTSSSLHIEPLAVLDVVDVEVGHLGQLQWLQST